MAYKFLKSAVSVVAMTFCTSAYATSLVYNGFSNTSGLTFAGSAGTATTADGTVLRVVPSAFNRGGAVYSTSAVQLGGGSTFSTQFNFRLTNPGGVDPADGFTFVLAASPNGLGQYGGGLGYYGVGRSVAVEFDTFNNGVPPYYDPLEPNSSNHVAVDENGILTNNFASNVYGNGSCGFTNGTPAQNSSSTPGCMSNGDLWTANISYDGADLSVWLSDPATNAVFSAIYNAPIDIPSFLGTDMAYVGFTASTGDGWQNADITSWSFSDTPTTPPSIPEPATWAMMIGGFGMIGGILRRQRKANVSLT